MLIVSKSANLKKNFHFQNENPRKLLKITILEWLKKRNRKNERKREERVWEKEEKKKRNKKIINFALKLRTH